MLKVAVLYLEAGVWAVALRVPFTTLTPAVVVPACEIAFAIAADVTQCCLYELAPEVLWQKELKSWKMSIVRFTMLLNSESVD